MSIVKLRRQALKYSATYNVATALHLVARPAAMARFGETTWQYLREHPGERIVAVGKGFKMVLR